MTSLFLLRNILVDASKNLFGVLNFTLCLLDFQNHCPSFKGVGTFSWRSFLAIRVPKPLQGSMSLNEHRHSGPDPHSVVRVTAKST